MKPSMRTFAGRALLTISIVSSLACARLPEPSRWPLPERVTMPDLAWLPKASDASDVCLTMSDATRILSYVNALQSELGQARLTILRANEER